VKTGAPQATRGATGRADLLRMLAVSPRQRLTLDDDDSGWFGYVQQHQPVPPAAAISTPPPPLAATDRSARRGAPLQMSFLHMVVEQHKSLAQDEEEQEPPSSSTEPPVGPLDEEATRAPCAVRQAGYEDLVPFARLLPSLRRQLGATRTGSLDLEQLTAQLASGRLPRRLPRRLLRRWHPELVVLLDFCPRLWPYREDMHRLAEHLRRHCGRGGVSLRIIDPGPLGLWSDWVKEQVLPAGEVPPQHPWKMPATGTPLLIVSDLGRFQGARSATGEAWSRFLERVRRSGVRPLVLAPLGAEQLRGLPPVPTLRWSPDAPAHPQRPQGEAMNDLPAGLLDLLALTAAARRVDPPLLRALRRLNPAAPQNAGLEGALWGHADVEPGFSAAIRPSAQAPHLRRFRELSPRLQQQMQARRSTHHCHLRAAVNKEEMLLWASQAAPEAKHAFAAQIEDAERFLRRLLKTLPPPTETDAARWWRLAEGILARADSSLARAYPHIFEPLATACARRALARGEGPKVPDWMDLAEARRQLGEKTQARDCWLVRDAPSGSLRMQPEPASRGQSPLTPAPLRVDTLGVRVQIDTGAHAKLRRVALDALPLTLLPLQQKTPIRIETSHEWLQIAPVRRPRGAAAWWSGAEGVGIETPPLAAQRGTWRGTELIAVQQRPRRGQDETETPPWSLQASAKRSLSLPNATLRFGCENRYGIYAEIEISTPHGRATQRLRWIEPGEFQMGSPESEPERASREGPRHRVRLTRGFWLADTACSQALWQAVMGDNPSGFQGDPALPVEQVSWRDVQEFLRKLETLLPRCEATLPTEAEWEYACRAGSDTPFSFGAQITPERVNYDGNHPYAGGAEGRVRGRTVPVKSLPANDWGLYEMHGNVWEWCADGLREYSDEAVEAPRGPGTDDDSHRIVRGGSWNGFARRARSACRITWHSGYRSDRQGFRLSLRSIESGPVS
jgi:formylglycine-generating enzyme required for sulfatase activity